MSSKVDELTYVDRICRASGRDERDIVDEYVRDELDAGAKKRFEGVYLRMPIR